MKQQIAPFLVGTATTVIQAMQQLEETAQKILFVVEDEDRLVGSLTDGDIRRWILAGGDLQDVVEKVCNREPYSIQEDVDLPHVRELMFDKNIGCVPVVNAKRQVVDLLFWEHVFKDRQVSRPVLSIALPVVIMAGGKGTRLDPFTQILPKPLIPLGDKTVIERIIDSFLRYGVSTFYLSINHKAKIIKSYFDELNPPYSVKYIEEEQPRGTAGSLSSLRGAIPGSFIVTNCDVIVNTDYEELLRFHNEYGSDITIVGSMKNYHIPYGICQIINGGELLKLTEKPEYNFLVNTGLYVLGAGVLDLVPDEGVFQMTDLIDRVKETGGKIAVFPVSDKAWLDTGEWTEYRKALQQLQVEL